MVDWYYYGYFVLRHYGRIGMYLSWPRKWKHSEDGEGHYVTKLSYNKDKALLWLFWEILPAFREGIVIDLFITICIPITQESIAVILTKVSLVVLNNNIFDVVIYFHYITITLYLSFEKGFIWIKLEFHTPKNAKSSSNFGFQNYLYYVAWVYIISS